MYDQPVALATIVLCLIAIAWGLYREGRGR